MVFSYAASGNVEFGNHVYIILFYKNIITKILFYKNYM